MGRRIIIIPVFLLLATVFFLYSLKDDPASGRPVRVKIFPDRKSKESFTLFFSDNGGRHIKVPGGRRGTTAADARFLVESLFERGAEAGLAFFRSAALLASFVDEEMTAYVDLSSTGPRISIRQEFYGLLSIARTLFENLPQIRRVKFLANGKDAETFAGHIDISQPFAADSDIWR